MLASIELITGLIKTTSHKILFRTRHNVITAPYRRKKLHSIFPNSLHDYENHVIYYLERAILALYSY